MNPVASADLVGINGFDERMAYGGQDRELGERLRNAGIASRQIRYSTICVHLDHDRPWRTRESLEFNASIRRKTRSRRSKWTDFGIAKAASGPAAD